MFDEQSQKVKESINKAKFGKDYPNGYFDCEGCGATKQSTPELCDSCKGRCDICSDEVGTHKVDCKSCKEKHNLCTACYESGHEISGVQWD